ncbi:MAG: hypothetical protein AAF065_02705 [Verrucomicrobiota bacterium]
MKYLSLILRVFAIAAAVAAAVIFFVSKGKLAELDAQLNDAQEAADTSRAELTTANGKIGELEANLNTERNKAAETKRNLEGVRAELYTSRQELTKAQQDMTQARGSIEELEDTTRRLRADLLDTEQKLASASREAEINQLNERIAELSEANEELEADLEEAKALPKNTALAASGPATVAPVAGSGVSLSLDPTAGGTISPVSVGPATTIQNVSSSSGLLVLDSRPELGLAPGQTITLVQDLQAVGKVQISTVTETLAIANILPGVLSSGLAAGDSVKLLR